MSSLLPHKYSMIVVAMLATAGVVYFAPPALAQKKAAMPEPLTDTKSLTTNPEVELVYRTSLGRADDVRLLLKDGINPNLTNDKGMPLLAVAAGRKDPEGVNVVRALLEGGANVNAKSPKGQTALFYAAHNGNLPVIKLLLQYKIDYYALDNNGDIARTYAFRAGRKKIVQYMDNFVKAQTKEVLESYNKAGRAKHTPKEAAKPEEEEVDEQEKADEIIEPELPPEEKKEKIDVSLLVYDISYNACAFQYWSFCQAANQTTELSDEELNKAILDHRKKVQTSSSVLMEQLGVGTAYAENIIKPSIKRVYDQLNKMPSRTYRREEGVGTMKDLQKRCTPIANSWQISDQKPATQATPAKQTPAKKNTKQKKKRR